MPRRRFTRGGREQHIVEIEFDEFGWEALSREAALQGVTIEELVHHAAIYYLAGDREGIARRVPRESTPPPDQADEPDD